MFARQQVTLTEKQKYVTLGDVIGKRRCEYPHIFTFHINTFRTHYKLCRILCVAVDGDDDDDYDDYDSSPPPPKSYYSFYCSFHSFTPPPLNGFGTNDLDVVFRSTVCSAAVDEPSPYRM
ncbi:hypothetical protein QTP88_020431 [Uroleucon formosanum]